MALRDGEQAYIISHTSRNNTVENKQLFSILFLSNNYFFYARTIFNACPDCH